jgi:hypothetical protein
MFVAPALQGMAHEVPPAAEDSGKAGLMAVCGGGGGGAG